MSNKIENIRCPNCEQELKKEYNFCPNCSQENKSLKIDFKHLLSEIFGSYLNLDSKLFKSLALLFFRPGFLTIRFLEGKRARYILPIRLYIVISILYFFILSLDSTFDNKDKVFDQSDVVLNFDDDTITYNSPSDFIVAIDSSGLSEYMDSIGAKSTFEKFIVTQAYYVVKNKGKGLFEEYLNNVSILMFLLLPFFALLLKLFFNKQKHFYNEHLIFSFHLHAFIFLFLSVYSLIASYILKSFSFVFVIVAVFLYSVFAVKQVYKYSYKSSAGRLVLLLFVYNIILILGLIVTIFVSFALY